MKKHEMFKVFMVPSASISENESVNTFLNSGIRPRSISVHKDATKATMCIGYIKKLEDSPHKYQLVEKVISHGASATLEEELEHLADELEGVICQDVHIGQFNTEIIFLTTKE